MTRLVFTVYGEAEPKGSSRALPNPRLIGVFRRGRAITVRSARDLLANVIVTGDNPAVKAWQAAIQKAAWCARQDLPAAEREPFPGAIQLQVAFYLPRPKGLAKSYGGPHLKKPDLDKLVRACKDALTNAGVWPDDSYVTTVLARKAYAGVDERPRAVIAVSGYEPPLFAARGGVAHEATL